jgi:hypothetical protein
MDPNSQQWQDWVAATIKNIDEHESCEMIKFAVPPRIKEQDGAQTYLIFSLKGSFQLRAFNQNGRRCAILEPVEYTPSSQPLPPQQFSLSTPGINDAASEPPITSAPSQPETGDTGPGGQSEGSGTKRVVIVPGGGMLLAADMTLMLTEDPGACLAVGPCYANVQEGAMALRNSSHPKQLSVPFTVDFGAMRRLRETTRIAAAKEAAFLRELELEVQKAPSQRQSSTKTKKKAKKKKQRKSKQKRIDADPIPEEEGVTKPVGEDIEGGEDKGEVCTHYCDRELNSGHVCSDSTKVLNEAVDMPADNLVKPTQIIYDTEASEWSVVVNRKDRRKIRVKSEQRIMESDIARTGGDKSTMHRKAGRERKGNNGRTRKTS